MIELIKGQTVSIDNHGRGNMLPISFDYKIHIHKRMNKDRYSFAEVFLYLAAEREMEIKSKGGLIE